LRSNPKIKKEVLKMPEQVDYEKITFEDAQLKKECSKNWENNPSLRKEFRNDFMAYFSYEKHKDHCTMVKGPVKRYSINAKTGEPIGFRKD
jgi:hypothetical protein